MWRMTRPIRPKLATLLSVMWESQRRPFRSARCTPAITHLLSTQAPSVLFLSCLLFLCCLVRMEWLRVLHSQRIAKGMDSRLP